MLQTSHLSIDVYIYISHPGTVRHKVNCYLDAALGHAAEELQVEI